MSPEQAAGAAVDGRSDQYSLACTLYEMLIGQPPFTGPSSQAVIARHSLEPVPSLRVVRQTVPPGGGGGNPCGRWRRCPPTASPRSRQFLDALESPDVTSVLPAVTRPSAGRSGTRGGPASDDRGRGRPAGGRGGAGGLWQGGRRAGAHPGCRAVTAIAVLPFQDLASSPDSSYLADGDDGGAHRRSGPDRLVEGHLALLGIRWPRARRGRWPKSRSELGVDAIVKGSIRRAGDSVRVNVRFLHAPDSTLLFAGDYQGRLGELPDLQREITVAITGSISAKLKGTERSRLDARREVDQRAYEAYLRGPVLPGARRARAGADAVRASEPNRPGLGAALRRPGELLHVASLLHRRSPGGGAAQGPGGAGPGPRARRDAGGSARGQRLHPGLLRVGLARRRAGVQTRPRAAAQLRRRVLLLQPLSRVTPPARRGHRAARPSRGAGPALAPAAGEPRPARLLRGPLRRGGQPAAGGPQERLHRRDGQVGAGARGGTTGETRRGDRDPGADQRRSASTASRRSAMPTRWRGRPPGRGASWPRFVRPRPEATCPRTSSRWCTPGWGSAIRRSAIWSARTRNARPCWPTC